MKNEALAAVFTKIAIAIASAGVIGGGSALLAATNTNSVQDQRLEQLEQDRQSMDTLRDALSETNKNVAVLNARLEERNEPRE